MTTYVSFIHFLHCKADGLGTFNSEDTFAVFSDILWLSFDASIYVFFIWAMERHVWAFCTNRPIWFVANLDLICFIEQLRDFNITVFNNW